MSSEYYRFLEDSRKVRLECLIEEAKEKGLPHDDLDMKLFAIVGPRVK